MPPRSTHFQDDPIPVAELAKHDGSDSSRPIYVAIKGRVFDVSNKREMYGPGASYNVFAGKDASRGLGESMRQLGSGEVVADASSQACRRWRQRMPWQTSQRSTRRR